MHVYKPIQKQHITRALAPVFIMPAQESLKKMGNGLEGGVEVADDRVEPNRHPLRHIQGFHRLGAAVARQEFDGQLRVIIVEV